MSIYISGLVFIQELGLYLYSHHNGLAHGGKENFRQGEAYADRNGIVQQEYQQKSLGEEEALEGAGRGAVGGKG